MPIIRTKLRFESQFVQVPNTWIRDKRLTRRARGLLVEIMSHQVGWKITIPSLIEGGPEGRDAVRNALKELEKHGYLHREQRRTDNQYDGFDFIILDPFEAENAEIPGKSQATENPSTENQTTENETTGEQPYKNTSSLEHQNEEENKKKKGGAGDTVKSPARAVEVSPPWKDLHGKSDEPVAPGRPDRCEAHQHTVNTPPCGYCKEAREAHQLLQKTQVHEEYLAEQRRQAQELQARQQQITDCDMCDEFGYLSGRPCHHDPEIHVRNRRGADLVRKAIKK